MNELSRRELLRMGVAASAVSRFDALRFPGATMFWGGRHKMSEDWSEAVIVSTMHRKPEAPQLGVWGYAVALYLYGMYLVYMRTGKRVYLSYIQQWVDSHVDGNGMIDRAINSLDYMLPGNLLIILFKETGQEKYKIAAKQIRTRLDTYPRTGDGGFWHATSRQHQLWLDGIYMSMPFLVRFGEAFDERAYTCNEATNQLLIYASHLNDPDSGLMFHAYDESGQQSWAQPINHHSSFFWCRAIGWFGMALVDVLEVLPEQHPRRGDLILQVRQLASAYQRWQDAHTGLWYQVVNRGDLADNWLETSSSCMYIYMLSRAVRRGYIPGKFRAVAARGYKGVLTQLSSGQDGFAHIGNICEGTNVGDLAYYLARPRSTDDFHGLGAFLIMNEELLSKESRGHA